MFQATSKKAGVDSEIRYLERPILMFSNSPNIFSLVNLDQYLPVVVNIAFPIRAKVFATFPALASWEGLAGHIGLPESKGLTGVFENIMSISYIICLDILRDQ